jgi:hypothetical protein
MKIMKNILHILFLTLLVVIVSCQPPRPETESTTPEKYNFIVLLDLSDRLIVQPNQPERDKEIIKEIYGLFEERVREKLYIRSRDEIKVVIAPQRGAGLPAYKYEDELYINMENIPNVMRRTREEDRRAHFFANLDTLYDQAVFSQNPKDYYGADIWKYFYEDLQQDYVTDTLTENYLFVLTDGYPIVGRDTAKLQPVNKEFPELQVILLEIAPREKDLEMDRIMDLWRGWLEEMNVESYTFIKRSAISKEIDQIKEIIEE